MVQDFPLKEAFSRGWIDKIPGEIEQLRAALNFFGVAGVKEWEDVWCSPQAAFRKRPAFQSAPHGDRNMAAVWRASRPENRLRAIQRKIRPAVFLLEIRKFTDSGPEDFERSQRLCASSLELLLYLFPNSRARALTGPRDG